MDSVIVINTSTVLDLSEKGYVIVTATETEYTTIGLDLPPAAKIIADALIREGAMREQERIIEKLKTLWDVTCCCDSSSFGEHYLSHRQGDNLIKFIKEE